MFVEEIDAPLVDSFGNGLANLMRTPPVNHIQRCPSVLGLGSGGGAHEQRVLQLALKIILLDMVRHVRRHLPVIESPVNSLLQTLGPRPTPCATHLG